MNFANEGLLRALGLLPLIACIWWLLLRKRQRRIDAVFDPPLKSIFAPKPDWGRLLTQIACLLIATALGLVAMARPRWGPAREIVTSRQHDLVIVLDVSRSMLARDVFPDRLERAKAMLHDLVKSAADSRIALVTFRGAAHRVCPLTHDTGFLLQNLAGLGIDSAPPGPTDLDNAVLMALQSFDPAVTGNRTVVMISDGEHLGDPPGDAIAAAQQAGISFLTIGIGASAGAPIPDESSPDGYQQHQGERIVSRMEHQTLERIALETGGIYVPLQDAIMDLAQLYRDHRSTGGPDAPGREIIHRQAERFQWFLLPSVLLFMAAACIRPCRPFNRNGHIFGMLLFCAIGSAQAAGDAESNLVRPARQAMHRYRAGNYAEAAKAFEAAAAKTEQPEIKAKLLYNAARAWYQAGDYAAAMDRLSDTMQHQAGPDPELAHDFAAASLRFARGRQPTDLDDVSALREILDQAAKKVQQALLESPRSSIWRDTLAVTEHQLMEITETERISRVFDKHSQKTTAELADELMRRQRLVGLDLAQADQAVLPERLAQRRDLAIRQREVSELLLPLSTALRNNQSASTAAAEALQSMRTAAEKIEDADDRAGELTRQSESIVYGLWKELAGYRSLLDENIAQQESVTRTTQTLAETEADQVPDTLVTSQGEALDLTGRLRKRLEETTDLALPPDREFVDIESYRQTLIDLAGQAAALQNQAADHLEKHQPDRAGPLQTQVLDVLEAIRDLLPPPEESEGSGSPPEQPETEEDDPGKDNGQAAEQPQNGVTGTQPHNEARAPPDQTGEMDPDQVEFLLERIRRHERDHLEERRRRAVIPVPHERDW